MVFFKNKHWTKILGLYDQNCLFWQLDASWRIWQENSAQKKYKLRLEVVLIFKKKDWAKILGIYDQNRAFWQIDASWRIWQANSAPKNFIYYLRWFWFSKISIEPKSWVSTTKIGHFDKLTHLDAFDRQIVLQKILIITLGGFDFQKKHWAKILGLYDLNWPFWQIDASWRI